MPERRLTFSPLLITYLYVRVCISICGIGAGARQQTCLQFLCENISMCVEKHTQNIYVGNFYNEKTYLELRELASPCMLYMP
jgi:hypothetical protein